MKRIGNKDGVQHVAGAAACAIVVFCFDAF